MKNSNELLPYENELPFKYAARLSEAASLNKPSGSKQKLGQYLTPPSAAEYMAGFAKGNSAKTHLRILDPGTGTAVLSCALAEKLASKVGSVSEIELVCYEIDKDILPYTSASLEYLKTWIKGFHINFSWTLHETDFITDNMDLLQQDFNTEVLSSRLFDYVISNPPFFKLLKEDCRLTKAFSVVSGQINVYSLFLYISANLLKTGGELIFLIPGSFCSGSSFRLFRKKLLNLISLEEIHFSGPDEKIFHSDSVLSGSVIIKGRRQDKQPGLCDLKISHCPGFRGNTDFSYSFLFNPKENIIPLASSETEQKIFETVRSWPGSLKKYGFEISAGKMLQSKAEQYSQPDALRGSSDTALFIGLKGFMEMFSEVTGKVSEKNFCKKHYILADVGMEEFLIPNSNYVIFSRYNTHNNKRKIMAMPYFKRSFEGSHVSIDKKLGYIYKAGGELDENETAGLSALLNSRIINTYIRIINGNINPGTDELSGLPLPAIEEIRKAALDMEYGY